VRISESDKKRLTEIIEKDTEFLASLGIMDYSMLLVIEYLDKPLGLHQAGSGVKVRSSNSQSSQADFLTVYKSEFKSAYQSS